MHDWYSYTALALYTGKQRKWLGPGYTALLQPISNRGLIPASHRTGGREWDGVGVVGAVALVMRVHEFGGSALLKER